MFDLLGYHLYQGCIGCTAVGTTGALGGEDVSIGDGVVYFVYGNAEFFSCDHDIGGMGGNANIGSCAGDGNRAIKVHMASKTAELGGSTAGMPHVSIGEPHAVLLAVGQGFFAVLVPLGIPSNGFLDGFDNLFKALDLEQHDTSNLNRVNAEFCGYQLVDLGVNVAGLVLFTAE